MPHSVCSLMEPKVKSAPKFTEIEVTQFSIKELQKYYDS